MKTYEGICRGGPWDGRAMAKDRSLVEVVLYPPWNSSTVHQERRGIYSNVAGQWVWHEAQEA